MGAGVSGVGGRLVGDLVGRLAGDLVGGFVGDLVGVFLVGRLVGVLVERVVGRLVGRFVGHFKAIDWSINEARRKETRTMAERIIIYCSVTKSCCERKFMLNTGEIRFLYP